ncbi:MAG: Trk system potassium transporter TrkA [Muribaculaceae bacterium]|nr:Trk system potassium transporter TrkA [Muribaculaceae bacterium]MBR1725576.1 Trk system potassium transporter TrkA [Muribaculaceae bacterium]
MKIVIAGAGEVGTHLAKMLSNEEQDIIIMDTTESKLAALENYNLMTYHGSATSFANMKEVKAGSADLFIGVTPYEARNILACQIAKSMGAKRTVARIDNDEYLAKKWQEYFSRIGVDDLIYPEYLAAGEIFAAIKRPWVRNWFEMLNGELILLGVKLRDNATFLGQQLKDLGEVSRFMHVSAIRRNRETIIPGGQDRVEANDIAYISTTRAHIKDVIRVCGKETFTAEKLFVMGGSEIAEQLIKFTGDHYHVKIVDPDLDRCQELADRLPDCNIVHGDARDTDLLEEEGISDYDAFIALSDSSEANILGCMMAKEHGVRKTVAQVENLQYVNEAEALNIGSIINKKLLASSRIFQIMLDSDLDNAKCLALHEAEVSELIVKEGAKVTRSDIKDLRLPAGITIAGLVRDGEGQLVRGNTRLQGGDHLVVFTLAGAIHKIDKAFK